MIKIEEKSKCCGCSACAKICPKNAIKMVEDEKGFKYPVVDKEKCIECGLCIKVCPIINKTQKENKPEAYAIINKNEDVRSKSSSGGIFTLLAEEIIKNGGVVFGARFDDNWRVIHDYVEKVEELNIFRGSKYLQSDMGDSYQKVKEFLEQGREVLFTGTPCQIEGLKAFLRKDYDNLYTQDIICHGVPSPKVHDKYLQYQIKKFNAKKVKKLEHRNKDINWKDYCVKIEFDKGEYIESHNRDPFMQAFLRDTILRDSCYDCQFKKKNRISDITLADFWGIDKVLPALDDNKGTSLVIINSQKGKEILEKIKDKITLQKVDFEEAIKYNQSMFKSVKKDSNREKFFEKLDEMEFDKLVKKHTYKPSIFKRGIYKIKKIVKKLIKYKK